MSVKLARVGFILGGALVLSACPSFSTLGTARTMARGHSQLYVATQAIGAVSDSSIGVLPQIELGVRYGLTDNIELGAKAWYLGGAAEAKLQLLRSSQEQAGLDLAILPSIGWYAPDKLTLSLPLLFGVNVQGGHQWVIGPRLVDQIWFDPGVPVSQAGNTLLAGGSVGFAWKLSPTVRLMPELSVLYPVVKSPGVSTFAGTGIAYQGGFAVLWGEP